MKAKLDTEYLIKKAKDKNVEMDRDIRFKNHSLLRKRLISYRIDDNHPWPNDNCLYLLDIAIKYLFYSPETNQLRNLYYLVWMITVSLMPLRLLKKNGTNKK